MAVTKLGIGGHPAAVTASLAGAALSLISSVGSFTLSGVAAALTGGRTVVSAAGSFTLSGVAAAFSLARLLISSVGSFTLSGVAVVAAFVARVGSVYAKTRKVAPTLSLSRVAAPLLSRIRKQSRL